MFGKGAPHGLALTRQGVPTYEANEDAAKGGYVLFDSEGADGQSAEPQVLLIGTGSEVHLAVEAREELQAAGIPTRVVSMPSVEWFEEQDQAYKDSVLPPSVKARVAVEAGIGLTWYRYVGDAGRIVVAGALRCLGRRQGPLPRVRLHRRARGRRSAGIARRRHALTPLYD